MLLGESYKETAVGNRTVYQFRCDNCGTEYEKPEKKSRREKPVHFCSIRCANESQSKDGVLDVVRRKGYRARLGVDYPLQSAAVRERQLNTVRERYGVDNVQQVESINNRACETFLKRLERKQRFMGMWVSKAENVFYDKLVEYFGNQVVRQKRIKGSRRPIDFWLENDDVYIQFDGVYWHGLDRPIQEIELGVTSHDQEIAQRWHNDRAQDILFKSKQLKLVRITDVEFDTLPFEMLVERIRTA